MITSDGTIKTYSHTPITIENRGVTASIKENGKVVLSRAVLGSDEYDEIEISASLIFDLAKLLKMTRKITIT